MSIFERQKKKIIFVLMSLIVVGVFISMFLKENTVRGAYTEGEFCIDAGGNCPLGTLRLTVTEVATCEEDGHETFECSSCGEDYKNTLPKLGHDYNTQYKICDANGTPSETGTKHNTKTSCGRTGCTYESSIIANHTYQGTSCTTSGMCVCGATESSLGHDYVWDGTGDQHWKACTRCTYEETKSPHFYAPATCTVPKTCECGKTNGVALEHNLEKEYENMNNGQHSVEEDCIRPNCNFVKRFVGIENHKITTAATCTTKSSECICGYQDEALEHDYGSTFKYDSTHHWKVCSRCSNKLGTAHSFSNNVCSACGYTVNSSPNTHTCISTTDWVTDDTKHWKICDTCSNKIDEEFHEGANWQDATDGTHTGICTTCNKTLKELHIWDIDNKCTKCGAINQGTACEHTYEIKWSDTKHWEECLKCKDKKENSEETHTMPTTWTDDEDGINHSKICTKQGCEYKEIQAHTWGTDNKCTACGADKPTEDPTCTHEEYEIVHDSVNHWEVCKQCKKEKENSKEAHTITTWVDNKNGTHTGTCSKENCGYASTKEHRYDSNDVCEDCDGKKDEQIDVVACEHIFIVTHDDTNHWEICSKCKEEKENSKEEHIITIWTDNGNGTHSGICTRDDCGYKATKIHNKGNDGKCEDCNAEVNDDQNDDPNDDQNDDQNNSNNQNDDQNDDPNDDQNNSNNQNDTNTNKDGTEAPGELPNTGAVTALGLITLLSTIGIVTLIKHNRLKGV